MVKSLGQPIGFPIPECAHSAWVVLWRQATHVDFFEPTFSARIVLKFKRLKWLAEECLFGFIKVGPKFIRGASEIIASGGGRRGVGRISGMCGIADVDA